MIVKINSTSDNMIILPSGSEDDCGNRYFVNTDLCTVYGDVSLALKLSKHTHDVTKGSEVAMLFVRLVRKSKH